MAFRSLAPSFLLSAPSLRDRPFERSVVLLGRHEEGGALGWILNGEAVDPVGRLLRMARLVPAGVKVPRTRPFGRMARIGGPVHPDSGWLIYRRERASFEGELPIGDELAVCSNPAAIQAILQGEEPKEFRLVLGYAGWGPGQLEAEIREGAWLPSSPDTELVFENQNTESLWELAFRNATGLAYGATGDGRWGVA